MAGSPEPDALERLRVVVWQERALADSLWREAQRSAFVERVIETAGARGLDLSREAVERAMSAGRRVRAQESPTPLNAEDFHGWLPARVHWDGTAPTLEWCYTGGTGLDAPFFEGSLQKFLHHPFNHLFRRCTPLAAMAPFEADGGVRPAGFIFHLSRCGSTLFVRLLAALPASLVLSEPPPFESLLHAPLRRPGIDDEQRITWLRRLVGAFGWYRRGMARDLFIKFDCWSLSELPLLQAAFPGVPCLFLYRDPIEVLVSHQRRPGMQMVPGMIEPALFGMEPEEAIALPPIEYRARVLAAICRAALHHAQGGRLHLVHYRELPDVVLPLLRDRFRVPVGEQGAGLLNAAARMDAKAPERPFVPDSGEKRAEATNDLRAAAEVHLYPLYVKLEAVQALQPRQKRARPLP